MTHRMVLLGLVIGSSRLGFMGQCLVIRRRWQAAENHGQTAKCLAKAAKG